MCIPNNRVSKYSGPLNNAGVAGSDPEQFKVCLALELALSARICIYGFSQPQIMWYCTM